jgi:hypothetical protein
MKEKKKTCEGKKKGAQPDPAVPCRSVLEGGVGCQPGARVTATARFEARTEYTALACHAFNAGQEAFCSPDTAKSVSTRTVEQRHHYNGLVGTTGVCATILGWSKGVRDTGNATASRAEHPRGGLGAEHSHMASPVA